MQGISNIFVPGISQYTAQSGRMSLPVDSSSVIYSNFQYVRGTPAPEGTNGIPINRLAILDFLIARFNQLQEISSQSGLNSNAGRFSQDYLTVENLETLIDNYRNMVLERDAASSAMPYLMSPDTQTGALINLLT